MVNCYYCRFIFYFLFLRNKFSTKGFFVWADALEFPPHGLLRFPPHLISTPHVVLLELYCIFFFFFFQKDTTAYAPLFHGFLFPLFHPKPSTPLTPQKTQTSPSLLPVDSIPCQFGCIIMASATARPTFFFRSISSTAFPSPKPKTTHCSIAKSHRFSPFQVLGGASRSRLLRCSIDVSKEDTPISNQEAEEPSPPPPPALEVEPDAPEEKFDKRRLEEKFAVLNTGIYECRSCGYKYDESVGDPSYPIPPGLPFEKIPADWRCPTCGAAKSFFESKSVEIAGFAQNQQFGLGGNALTSGQKALLIYGSLFCFFLLFLSGYFLQ